MLVVSFGTYCTVLIRCVTEVYAILTILTITYYTKSIGAKVDALFVAYFP